MKLQLNKKYVDGEGVVRHILGYSSVTKAFWDQEGNVYYSTGHGTSNNDPDLVKEFTEPSFDSVVKEAYIDWWEQHGDINQSRIETWRAAVEWYKTQI